MSSMPQNPTILLVDNGSKKAAATLQLRKIANQLQEQTNQPIYPVSLQHADVISADELAGIKASVFVSFLTDQLKQGQRSFIILPLFFGNSRALTKFIPDTQTELEQKFGKFQLTITDTLYTPPHPVLGSDTVLFKMSKIIFDHAHHVSQTLSLPLKNIVLVDHGSPIPEITAVRNAVAKEVQAMLGQEIRLEQAVMERRSGKQYDFNGELLEEWLSNKAKQGGNGEETSAIVVLLFSLPGRHAGEGGDIVTICDSVMQRYPDFKIGISPLVGEHPSLLEILADRLNSIQES